MGSQDKNSSPSNSLRVKVYKLNADGKWDDQGTGHVSIDYLEGCEDLGLIVVDEEDNENILVHRISSHDIYRRQEDTIISWREVIREPELSTELALSFQEATGCSYVWDQICGVQRNFHFSSIGDIEIGPRPAVEALEESGAGLQSNDDALRAVSSELRELPSVELSTLPLILKTVVDCGITDQMRVAELILQDQEFFPKLIDLFRMSEDIENMDGLHMIFRLVKGIILLNCPQIFERIFQAEYMLDIIGSLEYDPDVPKLQHHRSFLKEHVVFKEAIPIKDSSVLSRIHQTYRVGYIKDVILPRVLDEATIASLNMIINTNNAVVISSLKDDTSFIQELFARMRSTSTSAESKRDMVLFMHEFCSLSKCLQIGQQLRLFRDLASEGIFDIIKDMMESQDMKFVTAGTDILILFLNQDPNLLRSYVIQQDGNSLLGLLVKGIITDFGESMHCQFLEIIRILLDSYTSSGSQRDTVVDIFYEKHLDQLIDVIAASCPPRKNSSSSNHSSTYAVRVAHHGMTKPEILSNICDLLCFCVIHHPYKIKCSFLMNNAIEKVLFLTRRRERYLLVSAVRFMRTIISRCCHKSLIHENGCNPMTFSCWKTTEDTKENLLHTQALFTYCHDVSFVDYYNFRTFALESRCGVMNLQDAYDLFSRKPHAVYRLLRFLLTLTGNKDEHLIRHIIRNNLIKPIIEVFVANGDRYNMLHSGVLDLLEYVCKDIKVLVVHIVDCFWDQLFKFHHLATIQALRIKYEQTLENPETKNATTIVDSRKRPENRGLEKEEEDYFNDDSDEEDSGAHTARARSQNVRTSMSNGIKANDTSSRPVSVGLVDYDDDDDDDYNPPPRKPEASTDNDDGITFHKIKRKTTSTSSCKEVKLDVTKKQKLDVRVNDSKFSVTVASTCSKSISPIKKVGIHESSCIDVTGEASGSNIKNHSSNSPSTSNSLDKDIRQSVTDSPAAPLTSPSTEQVVNGKDVSGSEPYSVR